MLCQADPYRWTATTPVVRCTPAGDHHEVLLAAELLYPEGGGQPSDAGTVGGLPVLALRRTAEGVIHVLPGPVSGEVEVRVDGARRFDHMQQHTGQHLLSAIAQDRFGLATTAFHLGPERCDVELSGPVDGATFAALEEAVNDAIREARPVTARHVSTAEYATMAVRSRGLPDGHVGDVRLVEIAGVDVNTCGGTHLRSTGELGALKLLAVEKLARGTRLHFVAGRRVRTILGAALEREAALTKVLSCGPADHVAAAARLGDEAKALGKANRALQVELAGLLGRAIVPVEGRGRLHRVDADLPFLNAVGDAARAAHPDALFVLTGGEREGVFLVTGPEAAVAAEGPRVAERLQGRGGGARGKFQGKAARVDLS